MPANKFYLDEEKTNEIELSWRGIWKDITVKHNGTPIGGFENFRHLKEGNSFVLHDGSRLDIYYSSAYGDQGLRISHNGRPLKGSSGDPEAKLKGIFAIACFIGGLNFIVGALGQFEVSEMLVEMGANWILMVIGAAIIGLGYVTWKKVSAAALTGIILIIAIDILSTVYFAMDSGGNVPITGVGLKVLFIIQFVRGYGAITAYNEQQPVNQKSVPVSVRQPGE